MSRPQQKKTASVRAEARAREAIKLFASGMSFYEIAAHFAAKGDKVSHVTIKKYVDKARAELTAATAIRTPPAASSEDITARRERVFKLYLDGYSYRQIIAELNKSGEGVSLSTIKSDIDATLEELRAEKLEMAEKWRAREDERLNIALRVANEIIQNKDSDPGERLAALDRAVKISESLRKLWGLDTPVQINVTSETSLKAYLTESPDAWPAPPSESGS